MEIEGAKRMPMRYQLNALLLSVVAAFSTNAYADALTLVSEGKPQAQIVVAADASHHHQWAARVLQDYVKQASGAALPILTEPADPTGTLISVGHTKRAAKAGITTQELKYDGCKLIVKGNVLYLIGRDAGSTSDRIEPHRSGAQGTTRAVTVFLEQHVGVRWLAPGPDGTVVPAKKTLAVPATLMYVFSPAIAYCEGRTPYTSAIANYANNFRIAMKYLGRGGHSWEVHIPDREYFKEHPEYFALLPSGKRSQAVFSKETGLLVRNSHLCTSHPQVRQIMVKKIRAEFDRGYDMIQLGQSDAWKPCVCDRCMQMDDHRASQTVTQDRPAEKLWLMNKWILDELKKSHPNKKVNVLVYGCA